jgi:putative membrane protein
MKPSMQTLLAAAVTAALSSGPAWSQTGAPGSTPGAAPGAAGSPGTSANPGGRAGAADARAGASTLARADRDFVMEAAMAGMAEVEAGRLAARKASSPAVKQFAQKMVDDHTASNAELMQLAQGKGVMPPGELDRSHRKAMDGLEKRSGDDFDKAYMKMQVADHQKAVSLFEKQAKNGKDAELKQWAQAKLPVLREHLQMARSDAGDRAGRGGDATARGAAAREGTMPGSGSTQGSAASGSSSGSSASATRPGGGSPGAPGATGATGAPGAPGATGSAGAAGGASK